MEQVFPILNIAFLELKRIEAAVEIVENLSKSSSVTYLPSSGNNSLGNTTGGQNFLFKI